MEQNVLFSNKNNVLNLIYPWVIEKSYNDENYGTCIEINNQLYIITCAHELLNTIGNVVVGNSTIGEIVFLMVEYNLALIKINNNFSTSPITHIAKIVLPNTQLVGNNCKLYSKGYDIVYFPMFEIKYFCLIAQRALLAPHFKSSIGIYNSDNEFVGLSFCNSANKVAIIPNYLINKFLNHFHTSNKTILTLKHPNNTKTFSTEYGNVSNENIYLALSNKQSNCLPRTTNYITLPTTYNIYKIFVGLVIKPITLLDIKHNKELFIQLQHIPTNYKLAYISTVIADTITKIELPNITPIIKAINNKPIREFKHIQYELTNNTREWVFTFYNIPNTLTITKEQYDLYHDLIVSQLNINDYINNAPNWC